MVYNVGYSISAKVRYKVVTGQVPSGSCRSSGLSGDSINPERSAPPPLLLLAHDHQHRCSVSTGLRCFVQVARKPRSRQATYLTSHLHRARAPPELSLLATHFIALGRKTTRAGNACTRCVVAGGFAALASSPALPLPNIFADRIDVALGSLQHALPLPTQSPRALATVAAFTSDAQARTACPHSLTSTEHLALAIRPAAPVEYRDRPRSPGRPTIPTNHSPGPPNLLFTLFQLLRRDKPAHTN
ncbi:hypothetical protein DFH08DRAFT_1089142 [Mycena albidolilacea]|uniref:Uncharacterized protein n=1 Tax=Mycena albidolilacea TaxID=1033008 RepID=A0AAD7E9P0_9AGAR|nr:hypothetical protein DFH08DRAFT_1089142 [Mycena albidolilacea]